MTKSWVSALALSALAGGGALSTAPAMADDVLQLGTVVVTATRRAEPVSNLASTIQIIPEDRIRDSAANSMTDLLTENAIGFLSNWSPGQTSVNIRGGATDGQGRDYRSEVAVLINGRRAGTANLSKLSPDEVDHVEIIRGPASVAYGSQAIGGVINIITRDGRRVADGTGEGAVRAQGGSAGLIEGEAHYATAMDGTHLYAGGSIGRQGDYTTGSGQRELNTGWRRRGALLSMGQDFSDGLKLDVIARSDGVYDAGFRGSQWDTDNTDSRFNQSIDATLAGDAFGSRVNWTLHSYAFHDADQLNWGSERLSSGAPGYDKDDSVRNLDAVGVHFTPTIAIDSATDLLTGLEFEYSKLRNSRVRAAMPGAANTQTAPYDNNENDSTYATFGELTRRFFDNSVIARAGIRYTFTDLSLRPTPNQPLMRTSDRSFDDLTYSTGLAWQALPRAKLRAGLASGFRAPTATELGANYVTVGGTQTLGNAGLSPESSRQYEVGVTLAPDHSFVDVALFRNVIKDRITTVPLPASRSQYVNSPGDAVVQGVEVQAEYDMAAALGWHDRLSLNGNGVWNFNMKDRGASAKLTGPYRTRLQRMYGYQAAAGVVYGQRSWDARVEGVLQRPMYYDTEETLLIPQSEPNSTYVHRKDPTWIFNVRANYRVLDKVKLFANVTNIFDINYHPQYIALDQTPCIGNRIASNGGCGNSLPGRRFLIGTEVSF